MIRCVVGLVASACCLLALATSEARSAPSELRIGVQFGIGYLPIYVARDLDLINRNLATKGVAPVKVTIQNVAGAPQINDGLLSRTMDLGCGGISAMMVAWDKTKGAGDNAMRGVVALSSMPYELFTVDPSVKSLSDLSDRNKIGLPAVKVSIPAIFLEMAAARLYGAENYRKLDPLTVSLAQPDGAIALMSGSGTVDSYVFAPPFNYQVAQEPRVHRVWSSAELAEQITSLSMWTTARCHRDNPALMAAVVAGVRDAVAAIRSDPRRAAQIFIAAEDSKLSVDFVTAALGHADLQFAIAPQNSLLFARFLVGTGAIKTAPSGWKDYFFPEIAAEHGS